jgi:hypothetical protein
MTCKNQPVAKEKAWIFALQRCKLLMVICHGISSREMLFDSPISKTKGESR